MSGEGVAAVADSVAMVNGVGDDETPPDSLAALTEGEVSKVRGP